MKLTRLCLVFTLVLFQTLIIRSNYVVSASEDDDADAKAEDHHGDAVASDNKSTPESLDESSLKVLSGANDGSNKTPKKIRRTIRVRESAPPTKESPSGDVQARNGALTNNVEVKPDISIQMPQSSKSDVHPDKELPQNIRSRNSRLNKVPYKPRYTPRGKQIVPFQPQQQPPNYSSEPLIEEVKDDDNRVMMPYAEEKQQPYKVEEESPLEKDNISSNEIVNSDNQVYNVMSDSGNNKNVMLNNIGNSETVLIDGVGNSKLTKVSNVGNNEQHEHENGLNNNVNHETPPDYSDTHKQPNLQQHHHHHHYHNEPEREVKSSSANMQEKPFVQININGNEPEKHKLPAASSEAPLGASSVILPLINGASLLDLEKLNRLNQVGSSLENNINNASALSDILKSSTPLDNRQPLLVAQNPLHSNYMLVQQAPSLGQGLIGTPLVVAQPQPQIISPAATTTTLVDPAMSTSYLQQQINQQQQLQRQLAQQQRFQQQQLQQLMSMMSMMMRSQYPASTAAWPQYAQMWPPMNGFRPPMHRHSEKEREKKGKSRRERRERREQRRKRRREEEAEADHDLEGYDEEDEDKDKDEKEKEGETEKAKKTDKEEKKVNVKKSKANGKEKQPEEQPKSMLSRMVSGLGLPNPLRPSTSVLDKAAAEVPDSNEGQSVKKD